MASSTTLDVDLEEIDKLDGGMDTLDFQDFPHRSPETDKGKTIEFTNFPHSAVDSDDEEEEDKAKLIKEEKKDSVSFWKFAYYQQFFNVDTDQVGRRILGSMVPRPGKNYLVQMIRPNPDLYGPFWICTTLVFTTAIAGNLANYFSLAGKDYHWKYDFHKVTLAATAIFSYWWVIPLLLFGFLWWRGNPTRFTLLEMVCVYGYSLAIYIPISILWAIQLTWLQWLLVMLGAALSGSVLILTFWPAVSEDNKKIAFAVMGFIFVMHAALAAGFVLYFFYVPTAVVTPVTPVSNHTMTSKPVSGSGTGNPKSGNIAPVKDIKKSSILAESRAETVHGTGGVKPVPGGNAVPEQYPIQSTGEGAVGQAQANKQTKQNVNVPLPQENQIKPDTNVQQSGSPQRPGDKPPQNPQRRATQLKHNLKRSQGS